MSPIHLKGFGGVTNHHISHKFEFKNCETWGSYFPVLLLLLLGTSLLDKIHRWNSVCVGNIWIWHQTKGFIRSNKYEPNRYCKKNINREYINKIIVQFKYWNFNCDDFPSDSFCFGFSYISTVVVVPPYPSELGGRWIPVWIICR